MNITLFGTCRINGVTGNNNLNNLINYTQSTKEVIQQIKFLTGEISIPDEYNKLCFRTGLLDNKNISFSESYKELFLNTDLFVVEICSNKKYVCDGYYLHHLSVDSRFKQYNQNTPEHVLEDFEIQTQSEDEIINDIKEIQNLIGNRDLVLVSHYNSIMNGSHMTSRNYLINFLENYCTENYILFVNPSKALKSYPQELVITDDLGHYTDFGFRIFSEYLNDFIIKYVK